MRNFTFLDFQGQHMTKPTVNDLTADQILAGVLVFRTGVPGAQPEPLESVLARIHHIGKEIAPVPA